MGQNLTTPVSIVIAGAAIAAAVLIAFHWEIAAFGGDTYRLNRWSGAVVSCSATSEQRIAAQQLGVAVAYRCKEITSDEIEKKAVDKGIR